MNILNHLHFYVANKLLICRVPVFTNKPSGGFVLVLLAFTKQNANCYLLSTIYSRRITNGIARPVLEIHEHYTAESRHCSGLDLDFIESRPRLKYIS